MKKIILAALVAVTLPPAAHAEEPATDLYESSTACGAYRVNYILSNDTIQTLIAINGVPWRMLSYTQSPSGYVQKMYLAHGDKQALIDGGQTKDDTIYLSFYDADGKRTAAPVKCKTIDGGKLGAPRHYIVEDFVK